MSKLNSPLSALIACPQCDALSEKPETVEGQKVLCNGCGTKLYDHKVNSLNRTCAIAIAGLLVYWPAISAPIMNILLFGQTSEASLIDCILIFIEQEYYLVAIGLFVFTLAMPLVKLGSALYIASAIKFDKVKPSMLNFFRTYHQLDSWTMLNVFMLGIVVSIYKLVEMASLSIDVGFISIALLLVFSTLVTVTLDHHLIWEKLSEAKHGK